jgi:hypothetical protein
MDSTEYQKRKERKEKFRKFVVNFFIWLLIIAFVSTIGVYWGERVNVRAVKVLKIGRDVYYYQPGSVVNYTLLFMRDRLASILPSTLDSEVFNEFLFREGIDRVFNNGLIYAFAKENNVLASKDVIKFIITYAVRGNLDRTPDKGLLDYAKMEYANMALAGENGDIMNCLGFASSSELFSFYDLYSFKASAEILYLNYTNYIAKKIPLDELKGYYEKNIDKYINEITVDDIAVKSKELATEIHRFVNENGFENAVSKYKDKMTLTKNLVLSKKTGYAKRFELALKHKEGEVARKVQFENGEYHILKVVKVMDINFLPKDLKNELKNNYITENKKELISKFERELNELYDNIKKMLNEGRDFKEISKTYDVSYYRINNITPVSRFLNYETNKRLEIDLYQNKDIIDCFFGKPIGKAEDVKVENGYLFIKPLSRKIDTAFSYTNITSDVMRDYLTFKTTAISKDWKENLEKRYKYVVYTNEVEKLIHKPVE